jgi:hypothetical protein
MKVSELATDSAGHVMVAVRMPVEVADGLKKAAAVNDRTLSGELRVAARLYLETQEGSGSK